MPAKMDCKRTKAGLAPSRTSASFARDNALQSLFRARTQKARQFAKKLYFPASDPRRYLSRKSSIAL